MPLFMGGAAALGLIKSETVDKQREAAQRQLAAATQRWSPWTGLKANEIPLADPFGSAMQGAAGGAALGQSMNNSNALNNYLNAKTASGNFSGVPSVNTTNIGGGGMLSNGPWSGFGGPNPYS